MRFQYLLNLEYFSLRVEDWTTRSCLNLRNFKKSNKTSFLLLPYRFMNLPTGGT